MSALPTQTQGPGQPGENGVEIRGADWDRIAADAEFKSLVRAKARFIVPATVFFVVYYFALPCLVGYRPEWMARKVAGNVNVAYLFALSQFFMAWGLALVYVGVAAGWDRRAAALLQRLMGRQDS